LTVGCFRFGGSRQLAASPFTEAISVSLKIVHTDHAPAAIGPYSQGVVVNGLLFTAGQIAIDPATGQVVAGNVGAQTERVMANLAAVLATVDATWKHVVKTTVYLHDMADFPVVNEIYGRELGDARPARSTVQVSALPRGVLVEIDAVVAVP
jgi:2-iminobutanoate/2-iminopropanoate deaminase